MSSTWKRLALRAGLATAGGVIGVIALSTAAHADDRPAQQPRGTLGAVVDQVLPEPSTPAEPEPEPEPSKEPEPPAEPKPAEPEQDAPADEPTQTPDEPAADPVIEVPPAEVPVDVPPVAVEPPPVVDVPPVVVDPPPVTPAPAVPVVTPPAPITAPTPPATSPAPSPVVVVVPRDDELLGEAPETEQPAPTPATEPPAPALVDQPVPIGPTATGQLVDDGIYPPGTLPIPAPVVATCDDPINQVDDTPRSDQPVTKQTTRKRPKPDTIRDKPRRGAPCPDTPGTPGQAITNLTVKPPPPTGGELVADTVAGAYSRPVLHRLTHMRARSHTLASRTEHPEPGPA